MEDYADEFASLHTEIEAMHDEITLLVRMVHQLQQPTPVPLHATVTTTPRKTPKARLT